MTSPAGPMGLTQQAAERTGAPTDVRVGTVVAVTARGVDVSVNGGLVSSAAHLNGCNPAVGDSVAMIRFADSWLILGRTVGPGTATDSATPGSAAGTTLLAGHGLSGGGGTLATSTGAVVVVPRYGFTFYHPPGHWVLLLAGYSWYSSATNDWLDVALKTGSAILGQTDHIQAGNNFFGNFATLGAAVPPSFGGKGYSVYMTLQRINGTGTSRIDDATVRRGYLVALDLGDGSVVATT